jgi:hypothetical protein
MRTAMRARSNGKGAALLLILSGMILLLIGRANEATAGILVPGVAVLAAGFFVSFLPRHAIRRAEKEHRYRKALLAMRRYVGKQCESDEWILEMISIAILDQTGRLNVLAKLRLRPGVEILPQTSR